MPAALEAERVDRGVALLVGLSRVQASRLVGEGRVRILGACRARRQPAAPRWRAAGSGPGGARAAGARPGGPYPRPGPPPLEAAVVFADKDLVVVDKPAGLVVHPGAGNPQGTLVQQLVALFPIFPLPARRTSVPASSSVSTRGRRA